MRNRLKLLLHYSRRLILLDKYLFILLILWLLIYWQWWIPEIKVATDFPFVPQSFLKSLLNIPQTWMERDVEGMGEYTVFTLWSWPFNLVLGLLTNLGIPFTLLERVFWIMPIFFLSIAGIRKLGYELKLSYPAIFISSLFYLTNTYLLLLIDGGQLSIALAFAVFPLSFWLIVNSINKGIRDQLIAAICITVLGVFDIRFVYVLFLLTLTYFFYSAVFLKERNLLGWLKAGTVISSVFLLLNSYWLIVLLKAPIENDFFSYLTKNSSQNFANLGHAILMLSPHWYRNIFGSITGLQWEFIGIPILALLAPILKPKNKWVGFWLIVAMASLFLIKGSLDPFAKIYPWLFDNVPGFSLFRDSTKFYFLTALSYSMLIGVSIDTILSIFRKSRFKFFILILITGYLIVLTRPVWLGVMTGTFSVPRESKIYNEFQNRLMQDKSFSRVFWIPTKNPLGYWDISHPALEGTRLMQKRPFAVGTVGTYERLNFIREAKFMGEIFNVLGIGYVIYPPLDIKRDNIKLENTDYYANFLDQLNRLPWLSKIDGSQTPLFKVNKHQDRFFIASNLWWVIGSDDVYNESTRSAELNLADNALVFVEEKAGLGKKLDEFPNAKILLRNKDLKDLAASFINENDIFFPSRVLQDSPDETGWWKRETSDLVWWRDFLQSKYSIDNQDFDLGGGWAIAEGNKKLTVNIQKSSKGVLLVRAMQSSRGGSIKFYQNAQKIGDIGTKMIDPETTYIKLTGNKQIPDQIFDYQKANFRWFEVGNVDFLQPLIIETNGEINVINAISVIDKNTWESYLNKATNLSETSRIVDYEEGEIADSGGTVSYYRKNPTKYMVSVHGITKPVILIFSQSYNPFWQINGASSIPAYSLLNGFYIDKDGTYEVIFMPQKWISLGLAIAGISLIIVVTILSVPKIRHKLK